ncbi:hypothetical protein HanIR_Chr15g0770921 [Helianthus annuus]|nr:hypothetical protein HanIR_Chr15g0770921 [Helianthus annuus]
MGFDFLFRFDRFFWFRFGLLSILSVFLFHFGSVSIFLVFVFRFVSVFLFLFGRLFGFVLVRF